MGEYLRVYVWAAAALILGCKLTNYTRADSDGGDIHVDTSMPSDSTEPETEENGGQTDVDTDSQTAPDSETTKDTALPSDEVQSDTIEIDTASDMKEKETGEDTEYIENLPDTRGRETDTPSTESDTGIDTSETDSLSDTAGVHPIANEEVLYGLKSPFIHVVDRISGRVTPVVKIRLQDSDNFATRLDYRYQDERFYTLIDTTSGYDIAAVDTCTGDITDRHKILLDGQKIPKAEGLVISEDGTTVYISANVDPEVGDSEALLSLNLTTGEATMVVPQVNSASHDVDGLGMLPDGTLYVSDYQKDESETLFLNVENAETVRLSGGDAYSDIDFHPSWDILYGVNNMERTFGTVNPSTGGMTVIAVYPEAAGLFNGELLGIAAGDRDCEDPAIFGLVDNDIVRINPLDGKPTPVSGIIPREISGEPVADVFSKLVYDVHRTTFHVLRKAPEGTFHFDTLDPCTGKITDGPQIAAVGDPIQSVGSIAYAPNTNTFFVTYTQTPDTTREEQLGILNPLDGSIASIGVLSDGEIRDGDHLVYADGALYLGDIHLRSGEGEIDNSTFYRVNESNGSLTELAEYTELPCYMAYHPMLDTLFTADCHNLPEKDHIPRSVGVMDLRAETISPIRIGYYADSTVESPRVRGLTVAPAQTCH